MSKKFPHNLLEKTNVKLPESHIFSDSELTDRIVNIVNKELTAKERRVLILKYTQNLKKKKVMEILGINKEQYKATKEHILDVIRSHSKEIIDGSTVIEDHKAVASAKDGANRILNDVKNKCGKLISDTDEQIKDLREKIDSLIARCDAITASADMNDETIKEVKDCGEIINEKAEDMLESCAGIINNADDKADDIKIDDTETPKEESNADTLAIPVEKIEGIPDNVAKTLIANGIKTLDDLGKLTRTSLSEIKGIGEWSVNKICDACAVMGVIIEP